MSTPRPGQPSSAQLTSGSIRRRARKACDPCRRRKRKCDGIQPCRSCREYEYTCTYEDERPLEQASGPSAHVPQDAVTSAPTAAESRVEVDPDKLYEPNKGRFYTAESAISFPRALALSLEGGVPPRTHSFAYNVGVADEHFLRPPEQRLADLMHFEKAWEYSTKYFETVNTLFAIVDPELYLEELPRLWPPEIKSSLEFETVACFVILLGSFFAWPQGFEGQQGLIEWGQILLDRCSFNDAPSLLHFEYLQAWSLRIVFVRCTTRPNITWMSSSIAMHLAESLGFHRELDTLEKLDLNVPGLTDKQIDMRRRLFWIAWTLNRMVSFEIGRSATYLSSINTLLPRRVEGSSTDTVVRAYQCIYPSGSHIASENPETCLMSVLEMGDLGMRQDPLLALVRADMACGLYRVIHKHSSQIRQSVGEHLVAVVKRGLEAARLLTEHLQPWWLLTSMPFQFICVAVAVGKSYILNIVPQAMKALELVDHHFHTKMTQEACETARLLLQTAAKNRDEEAAAIYKALAVHEMHGHRATPQLEEEDWNLYYNSQYMD